MNLEQENEYLARWVVFSGVDMLTMQRVVSALCSELTVK